MSPRRLTYVTIPMARAFRSRRRSHRSLFSDPPVPLAGPMIGGNTNLEIKSVRSSHIFQSLTEACW
jgi:hypothetical protein